MLAALLEEIEDVMRVRLLRELRNGISILSVYQTEMAKHLLSKAEEKWNATEWEIWFGRELRR